MTVREYLEASFAPESYDEEANTIRFVFTSGALIRRYPMLGEPYDLQIMQPAQGATVRLERINSGRAPLLDGHNSGSVDDVLGMIQKDSVHFEDGRGVGEARLSTVETDADRVAKIAAGFVGDVSMGFDIYDLRRIAPDERDDGGELELRQAWEWEPFEVSAVPMGADPGAQFTSREQRLAPINEQEGETMPDENPNGTETPETKVDLDAKVKAAVAAERARVAGIRHTAETLGLDRKFADDLVDREVELSAAKDAMIDERAKLDDALSASSAHGVSAGQSDEKETLQRGLEAALWWRVQQGAEEITEIAKPYRSYDLLGLARLHLESTGVKTGPMTPGELARRALVTLAHTPTDFPLALGNTLNKSLRAGYAEIPRTFTSWARRTSFKNMRAKRPTMISGAPGLLPIAPGGAYLEGTIEEGQEEYSPTKYGRMFLVTWETLINDDLDALGKFPAAWAASAARTEGDVVYALLTANGNMADGVALFDAAAAPAGHQNYITPGVLPSLAAAANSVAHLSAMRLLMGRQTGLADEALDLMASHLILPLSLEDTLDTLLRGSYSALGAADAVPKKIAKLQIHADPRLDTASATHFYMAADPSTVDTIEYAYLDGENGLVTDTISMPERDVLGTKARLVFGAGVIDYRGLVRSDGGTP